jgi:hypothetical protein
MRMASASPLGGKADLPAPPVGRMVEADDQPVGFHAREDRGHGLARDADEIGDDRRLGAVLEKLEVQQGLDRGRRRLQALEDGADDAYPAIDDERPFAVESARDVADDLVGAEQVSLLAFGVHGRIPLLKTIVWIRIIPFRTNEARTLACCGRKRKGEFEI